VRLTRAPAVATLSGGLATEGETMSDTQTIRVGADAGLAERRRGGTQPPGRRQAARRARGARHVRNGYPQGRVRFVTGVALIVALATATFGVEAYVRVSRAQSRVATLQADLASLKQRVYADEHGAASDRRHVRTVAAQASSARGAFARVSWALQSVPSEAQMAGVRNELAAYAACTRQLQSEIAGLGISWRVNAAKPSADYFKLSTAAPISASCSNALTGR
jgi:hypothetical protein